MLTVSQALEKILTAVTISPSIAVPLRSAVGRVLAETVVSSIDSPPFDKSLMDGYAVCSSDGGKELDVAEEVTAGNVPTVTVRPGIAVRVMTGTPIPAGADAVVRVEEIDSLGPTRIRLRPTEIRPGNDLIRRAASLKVGETVLSVGSRLGPSQIGALAEIGRYSIQVYPQPRVAVLATGDELVEISETPGPGQIRNSNEPMLAAQVAQAGAEAVCLGIARDNRADLATRIGQGLSCNILCLSGGVSAGVLDLVPSVLQELGVKQVFHKVQVKPGKPLWFGVYEPATLVFGLPGNPVSSLVCFELFVRPAIRRLQGIINAEPRAVTAHLSHAFGYNDPRPTYHPSLLDHNGLVKLVPWQGSCDLRATAAANSMTLLPAGSHHLSEGAPVVVYRWE